MDLTAWLISSNSYMVQKLGYGVGGLSKCPVKIMVTYLLFETVKLAHRSIFESDSKFVTTGDAHPCEFSNFAGCNNLCGLVTAFPSNSIGGKAESTDSRVQSGMDSVEIQVLSFRHGMRLGELVRRAVRSSKSKFKISRFLVANDVTDVSCCLRF
jgi:hypothetical protein